MVSTFRTDESSGNEICPRLTEKEAVDGVEGSEEKRERVRKGTKPLMEEKQRD